MVYSVPPEPVEGSTSLGKAFAETDHHSVAVSILFPCFTHPLVRLRDLLTEGDDSVLRTINAGIPWQSAPAARPEQPQLVVAAHGSSPSPPARA